MQERSPFLPKDEKIFYYNEDQDLNSDEMDEKKLDQEK